jgi:NAD(P)-dependent dehydrogenase (short-subunit alcohol dehydrogenase family)
MTGSPRWSVNRAANAARERPVLVVGRNADRGAAVLAALNKAGPGAGHALLRADLALLRETARAADQIAGTTDRLDAVVLCAGVLSTVAGWTDEDLERSFVLNYCPATCSCGGSSRCWPERRRAG